MSKTRSNSRGDIHKQMILDIIRRHSWGTKGIHPDKIANLAHMSRQAVHGYLKKLMAEEKIKTKKGTYLDSEIIDAIVFDGWSLFESYTNEFSDQVMDDNKFFLSSSDLQIPIDCYRNRIDISKKPEQFIFEFANTIGAVMTYFFIESLTPRRNVKADEVRYNVTERFIKEIIPYMGYLWHFHRMLPVDSAEKSYLEVKENSLKIMSEAYKNMYPGIHNFLNDGYQKFVEDFMLGSNGEKSSECNHEWKTIYVHKIGNLVECSNCGLVRRSDNIAKI
jgi:hypothetical protein